MNAAPEKARAAELLTDSCEVSVVLPCRNEAATVGECVRKARETFERLGIKGEVVVVDNGSTDGSAAVARRAGARVVTEPEPGYGTALNRGIAEAGAPVVIMADADNSYDLADLGRFLTEIEAGADLVMGSRNDIHEGAMPWLHRWVGNPVLSGLLRLLFGARISDAHCGMRAFTKEAWRSMRLQTTGMEFASEMIIKAVLGNLRITEVPISLRPDGRDRRSHLRPLRDGWRHLRFMLLFSPMALFLVPSGLLMALGLLPLIALASGPIRIGPLAFDVHHMVLGSLLIILGFQIALTGMFAKVYSHSAQLDAPDRVLGLVTHHFNLERGLALGALLLVAGFGLDGSILVQWLGGGMGLLDSVRPAIQASTLMIIGAQTIFASFFLSILVLGYRGAPRS